MGRKLGLCPFEFQGELGLHLTQFSPGRGLPRHQVVSLCIQLRPLCVRWDPSPPPRKGGGTSPSFRPMSLVAKWLNWSRCHIVLDGDPAAHPERGTAPIFSPTQFSTHVCYGQTAGWIKMPLGTEIGLGPGHTVKWEEASSPKMGTAPNFSPMLIVAKRSPISAILLSTCYFSFVAHMVNNYKMQLLQYCSKYCNKLLHL